MDPRTVLISSILASNFRLSMVSTCAATTTTTTPATTLACANCAATLVEILMNNQGAKDFTSVTPGNNAAGCATLAFVCTANDAGSIPSISLNDLAAGEIIGTVGETADTTLTCNAAGTAFELAGVTITQIECDAS